MKGYRLVGLGCVALLLSCSDEPQVARSAGEPCEAASQCESTICYTETCVDPALDDDGDGLINEVELSATIGTNPFKADTDGDGLGDSAEIVDLSAPLDEDGDGTIDALESATADADGDCLVDQKDADDTEPLADAKRLADLGCCCYGECMADWGIDVAPATCEQDEAGDKVITCPPDVQPDGDGDGVADPCDPCPQDPDPACEWHPQLLFTANKGTRLESDEEAVTVQLRPLGLLHEGTGSVLVYADVACEGEVVAWSDDGDWGDWRTVEVTVSTDAAATVTLSARYADSEHAPLSPCSNDVAYIIPPSVPCDLTPPPYTGPLCAVDNDEASGCTSLDVAGVSTDAWDADACPNPLGGTPSLAVSAERLHLVTWCNDADGAHTTTHEVWDWTGAFESQVIPNVGGPGGLALAGDALLAMVGGPSSGTRLLRIPDALPDEGANFEDLSIQVDLLPTAGQPMVAGDPSCAVSVLRTHRPNGAGTVLGWWSEGGAPAWTFGSHSVAKAPDVPVCQSGLCGDVNGDFVVSQEDLQMLQSMIEGAGGACSSLGDLHRNGVLDETDAVLLTAFLKPDGPHEDLDTLTGLCDPCFTRQCGDVDGDGEVGISDGSLAVQLAMSLGTAELDACGWWALDINGDGDPMNDNLYDITVQLPISTEGLDCAAGGGTTLDEPIAYTGHRMVVAPSGRLHFVSWGRLGGKTVSAFTSAEPHQLTLSADATGALGHPPLFPDAASFDTKEESALTHGLGLLGQSGLAGGPMHLAVALEGTTEVPHVAFRVGTPYDGGMVVARQVAEDDWEWLHVADWFADECADVPSDGDTCEGTLWRKWPIGLVATDTPRLIYAAEEWAVTRTANCMLAPALDCFWSEPEGEQSGIRITIAEWNVDAETIETHQVISTHLGNGQVRDGQAVVGLDGTIWVAYYHHVGKPSEVGTVMTHIRAAACPGGCDGAEAAGPED